MSICRDADPPFREAGLDEALKRVGCQTNRYLAEGSRVLSALPCVTPSPAQVIELVHNSTKNVSLSEPPYCFLVQTQQTSNSNLNLLGPESLPPQDKAAEAV